MNTKKYILFLGFVLIFNLTWAQENQEYLIKSACYWTSPTMTDNDAKSISLYKIAVVDGENLINNPERLRMIKKLNSNIKLLCYQNPMEIFNPMVDFRPMQSQIADEILHMYPEWLLKNSSGKNVVFYPGMIMLNLSTNCPRVGGKNCAEYLAEKQLETLQDRIWDGSFDDNGGKNISWVDSTIDSDNDHLADNPDSLDQAWSDGVYYYLSLIKTGMRKNMLLIANKGSLDFLEILDGRMFEKFPNNYLGGKKDNGWHKCMLNAQKTGLYTIFLVEPRDLMFGLASALLTDNGYIAIGQDNPKVHPELNFDLGKALSPAQKADSSYFRLYEKGRVEVFPSIRKGVITLN